jgi:predicted dehydrogenase
LLLKCAQETIGWKRAVQTAFNTTYAAAPVLRAPLERATIRVGVIGAGFGASVHVPALRRVPGIEVAALCTSDWDRARDAADSLEIPRAWDDYREMFASGDIDAVSIAAPPHLHHPMTLAACESGLHILCEKPMARGVAEARDMLRMAREAGVCHAIAHQLRHDPVRARVKGLIDEGFVGPLHSVSVVVFRSTLADPLARPWGWLMDAARGGGVLGAIGSHYVDALRWWFGDVHAVCGAIATAVPERLVEGSSVMRAADADDNTAFVLRFANGGIGTVHISYTSAADVGEEIMINGGEGTLALHDQGQLFGARRGEKVRSLLPDERFGASNQPSGTARAIGLFSMLAGEWVLAMRTGQDANPSFEDGAKVQEVLDAVPRSQQLNRWIDLSGNKWPV